MDGRKCEAVSREMLPQIRTVSLSVSGGDEGLAQDVEDALVVRFVRFIQWWDDTRYGDPRQYLRYWLNAMGRSIRRGMTQKEEREAVHVVVRTISRRRDDVEVLVNAAGIADSIRALLPNMDPAELLMLRWFLGGDLTIREVRDELKACGYTGGLSAARLNVKLHRVLERIVSRMETVGSLVGGDCL